ncbi:MAG: M48 family metallopeptidase [Prolixibacteraceae bacterium]|nr:M48 family metallopeptidase [Prolixibacteraceae bacterium]
MSKLTSCPLEIQGIGQVLVTRRKGSRRISMRIGNDGSIRVCHPWFVSKKEVERFIINNAEWIEIHKNKISKQKKVFSLNQEIKTFSHSIKILPTEKGKIRAGIHNETVIIAIPETEDVNSHEIQDYIKKIIINICRSEAKLYLPQRVKELAGKHNFNFNQVYIKYLKSKWGSCSSAGNINLNLILMLQPSHLIDYIILHELSHTMEPNHGKKFWDLLDKITDGKAKELNKEMKICFFI